MPPSAEVGYVRTINPGRGHPGATHHPETAANEPQEDTIETAW
jgi:hypothetical protein